MALMTRTRMFCALVLLAGVIAVPGAQDAEDVIFFPTYGFRQGDNWIIPLRAKVQEPRRLPSAIEALLSRFTSGEAADPSLFRSRIADFFAKDEPDEDVRLQFEQDAERKEYRIANGSRFPETNGNGVVDGTFTLSVAAAQRLLSQQGSPGGWLTFRATSSGHTGTGRVRLIEANGVSVISDIDDTIKVTGIPAGSRTVALNTFFRTFQATTELDDRYKALAGAPVHYVSGGPWQLYRPIAAALIATGRFPEGTFHMKSLTGGTSMVITSLEDLARFVTPGGTVQHKVGEIGTLMQRFKDRKFVLIGDSGERDPEIYREVQGIFGAQVQEIVIRDVKNARQLEPDRLTGMTVVVAPTVTAAVPLLSR